MSQLHFRKKTDAYRSNIVFTTTAKLTAQKPPQGELSEVALATLVGYFQSHPPAAERIAQIQRLIADSNWQEPQSATRSRIPSRIIGRRVEQVLPTSYSFLPHAFVFFLVCSTICDRLAKAILPVPGTYEWRVFAQSRSTTLVPLSTSQPVYRVAICLLLRVMSQCPATLRVRSS